MLNGDYSIKWLEKWLDTRRGPEGCGAAKALARQAR